VQSGAAAAGTKNTGGATGTDVAGNAFIGVSTGKLAWTADGNFPAILAGDPTWFLAWSCS